jgi:hypothetical protein
VNEVERRTGYDFLTRVPESVQWVIERRVDDGPTHVSVRREGGVHDHLEEHD